VRLALAVGDRQRLVCPVAQPAHLGALLGSQHRSAERAEDVVVGGGAFAVAGVRAEAQQHPRLGEFAEAVLGAVQRVEERRAELVGGEHAVLVDEADDGAVAVGKAAGEGGELLGDAPPPGGFSSGPPRTGAGTLVRFRRCVHAATSVRSRRR